MELAHLVVRLFGAERQAGLQHLYQVVFVVGVGQDGPLEFDRGTCKFGQHQNTWRLVHRFGRHILFAHEVQAVAQGRDPCHIGGQIKSHQLFKWQAPVKVAHRRPVHAGKAAVDAPHNAVQLLARFFVNHHARGGGGHDVEHDHFFVPLRVLLQKPLEGLHLFDRAFDVIEPLHRQHNFSTARLGQQVAHAFLGAFGFDQLRDALVVNAHGVRAHTDQTIRCLQLQRHLFNTQGAPVGEPVRCARGFADHAAVDVGADHIDEIFDIPGNVKPDVIALEQTGHDLPLPRQHVEDVGAREGRVVKKADVQIGPQCAQIRGHHPEVVVMDPNRRTLLGGPGGGFGKQAVDLAKMLPMRIVEGHTLGE